MSGDDVGLNLVAVDGVDGWKQSLDVVSVQAQAAFQSCGDD
jgi:hypothetical protein